jgi:hypothetical protein
MFVRFLSLLLNISIAGAMASAVHASAAQVDACKLIGASAVNAAARAWFGATAALTQVAAPGARGGTCRYYTDAPRHVDLTIFYAPGANPGAYGLSLPAPANETPVSSVGERAVYDQSNMTHLLRPHLFPQILPGRSAISSKLGLS